MNDILSKLGFKIDLSGFKDYPSLIEHLKNTHRNLFTDGIVKDFAGDLLIAGAILILAEKVDKLSTSAVTLAQSQTDMTAALTQLGTDLQNAINVIKNGNPSDPQVQQAATFIETAAQQLQGFDASVQSALNPTPTPTGSGTTPTSGAAGTGVSGAGSAAANVTK